VALQVGPTTYTTWPNLLFTAYYKVYNIYTSNKSRGDSVRTVSTGRTTGFDSRQWQRRDSFSFTTASRPVLGPTQPPIQWIRGALSPEVKRPRREAGHYSPSPSSEFMNVSPLPQTSSWRVTFYLYTANVLGYILIQATTFREFDNQLVSKREDSHLPNRPIYSTKVKINYTCFKRLSLKMFTYHWSDKSTIFTSKELLSPHSSNTRHSENIF
jgi:hypothetical protein